MIDGEFGAADQCLWILEYSDVFLALDKEIEFCIDLVKCLKKIFTTRFIFIKKIDRFLTTQTIKVS